MRFRIEIPSTYKDERSYILSLIFSDIFQLAYNLVIREDISETRITADDGRCLALADGLFCNPRNHWLKYSSLPEYPLEIWNVGETKYQFKTLGRNIPVIYGENPDHTQLLKISEDTIKLGLDIFGSSFFMLTRYEEVVQKDRDEFGRFPSSKSIAYKNNFLHRPIVNEYIEILWRCLKILWPGLIRNRRQFKIIPTHDVDLPYKFKSHSLKNILFNIGGAVIRRRRPSLNPRNFIRWINIKAKKEVDPFDSFDWIMDQSESAGLTSIFNFMTASRTEYDPNYNLSNKSMQNLIQHILARGHQIGFHPSYSSPIDPNAWTAEYDQLKSIVPNGTIRGGRQHMLRFQIPDTWRIWEKNGLDYDSSLAFADRAGFRCGICYEYPVYDLEKQKTMTLKERPLIIMECSIIDQRYMGLGRTSSALDYMVQLRENCRLFDGDFVLLWHNDRFENPKEREMYASLIHSS